ncbi:MAG: hypothetical protein WC538_12640 [Thermoanaerobaculia bacterium]|jgi:hypothetical protein
MTSIFVIADVVWPGIIVAIGLTATWAVVAGLLFEYPFVKWITGMPWRSAWRPTLVINVVSALVGLVAIPLGGLGIEIGRSLVTPEYGTFNPVTWALTFGLALAANTAIEGALLVHVYKVKPTVRMVLALIVANCGSIGVTIWLVSSGRLTVN